jgi:hypothetical protein
VQNANNLLHHYTLMRKVFKTMGSGGGVKAQQKSSVTSSCPNTSTPALAISFINCYRLRLIYLEPDDRMVIGASQPKTGAMAESDLFGNRQHMGEFTGAVCKSKETSLWRLRAFLTSLLAQVTEKISSERIVCSFSLFFACPSSWS